jgi:hypothetical protein
MRRVLALGLVIATTCATVAAQDDPRGFAGLVAGVSTLSADGRAVTSGGDASVSLYKPENGPALNAIAGYHVSRFVSVQGNYVWNRNDLTLLSSVASTSGGGYYEEHRGSSQHAFVADLLVYFRRLGSGIRPYLGTGLCVVRFTSGQARRSLSSSLPGEAGRIASRKLALRSHVGIDFALSRRVSFRYSFSETISGNPISPHLMPPGERWLANFQNLFGFVATF